MSTLKNSSTSILIVHEHILLLLHATREFAMGRINDSEDKKLYGLGNGTCREIIALPSSSLLDAEVLVDRLMESKLRGNVIKHKWYSSSTPRAHYQLAHDHAIEIVRSLDKRFITGVSSESRTVHREVDVQGKQKVY